MKKIASKELIIGSSVIIAIAILIFGIEYLKGINMFSPANFYYVYYDNVNGLEKSAPVTIDGYKVGQVREVSFDYNNPGKIKVLLAVDKQLRIPEDSYAELSSTLMSGSYVNIHLGSSKKMLAVGSDVPSKESKDLMESLSADVMPTVNSILPKVDTLMYNLNLLAANPALMKSINRIDGITGNVYTATQGLNTTVNTINSNVPVLFRNVGNVTVKIDSVSQNLMMLSQQLRQLPLDATMENVNDLTANLVKFSEQLNNQNSTLGLLTNDPELYNRLNKVSADIDSLILDIKKNPKRYISIKLL